MTFASHLTRLDAIVAELERNDLPLDRALELFEEGIAHVRSASEGLAQAEGRVRFSLWGAGGSAAATGSS